MALKIITIALLGMLPVSELRGAIPYGIVSGLNPVTVFITAVASNMLVAPLTFLFLDYVHHHLMLFRAYGKLFGKFVERTKHKAHGHISKYGYLGLMLLVAAPLPFTGAYTGALAAWLFGMERKKAFAAISAGVIAAGIIVMALSLAGTGVWGFINSIT